MDLGGGRTAAVAAAGAGVAAERDDLSRIKGLSQSQAASLHEAGYHRYGQIATLSNEQEAALEARLGLTPGTIAREDWREQARALEGGAAQAQQIGDGGRVRG